MKLRFVMVGHSKEAFHQEAVELYKKKISGFIQFEFLQLKPKSSPRDEAHVKKERESQEVLKKIDAKDFVVLFDEKGAEYSSVDFSRFLVKSLEDASSQVTFVIGGAYGASEELKSRANKKVSLSKSTMNHLVASVVALEQIYRGLTIWKGIPYHNE